MRIDSLDLAQGIAEGSAQADTMPWTIVLASRPTYRNYQLVVSNEGEAQCVGELQPLRYPDDVESFFRRWFGLQREQRAAPAVGSPTASAFSGLRLYR